MLSFRVLLRQLTRRNSEKIQAQETAAGSLTNDLAINTLDADLGKRERNLSGPISAQNQTYQLPIFSLDAPKM